MEPGKSHDATLLCSRGLGGDFANCCLPVHLAFLPEFPDRPDDEALQGSMGFPSRLAFGYPSIEVGLGLWQMVSLGKHDEVQHVVETPVATSVEAMARVAG